ncbi:rhomboid family intramembrane serine protease [uncultured Tessaracoccus sp.]|uniref:rhomboid family intramembrane serine protease n=1 Tax=uncultured Tessaracoccus sp. TaxID=905023 RepID=UPI00261A2070|nr:rhomboid family intramembrane serine protease [uncultured Tessaracoccus sp.]
MPWFRIGRVDVTTTVLVVLLASIGALIGTVSSAARAAGVLTAPHVFSGEPWRLITWPWIDVLSIWSIFTLVIFWYFGKMLESDLGRDRMASFLVGLWAVVTASHLFASMFLPGSTMLMGLSMIQLLIILLFIMEQPNRPFFFGIPAWIIGAILVGLQVLGLVVRGNAGGLVALLLSLGGGAVWARRYGLLSALPWALPKARAPRAPRPSRAAEAPKPTRNQRRARSDEDRLDELLEKISKEGLGSLSRSEHDELLAIRERRHQR